MKFTYKHLAKNRTNWVFELLKFRSDSKFQQFENVIF